MKQHTVLKERAAQVFSSHVLPPEKLTQQAAALTATSPAPLPDAPQPAPVVSPCVSVCRMNADQSHCEGCFRSIPEICAWAKADSTQRLTIWEKLMERQRAYEAQCAANASNAVPPDGLLEGQG
jgi:predicted Fe-S protein YdhL (DUF1289 family)